MFHGVGELLHVTFVSHRGPIGTADVIAIDDLRLELLEGTFDANHVLRALFALADEKPQDELGSVRVTSIQGESSRIGPPVLTPVEHLDQRLTELRVQIRIFEEDTSNSTHRKSRA